MSPSLELRPLALGEIIDRSATFWRGHLKHLFLLSLGFDLTSYIATKGMQLAMTPGLPPLGDGTADPAGAPVWGELGRMLFLAIAVMQVLIWLYWSATLVVTRYVVPALLGEPVPPTEGLRRALRSIGTLTGAYLLSQLWALGMALLLILPGGALLGAGLGLLELGGAQVLGGVLAGAGLFGASLGLVGAFLWYLLRFCLLAPALAMEDLSVMGAFRRSGELLSGRVGPGLTGYVKVRAMILVTVVTAILLAVSLLTGLPALLARFAHGNPLDPAAMATQSPPQLLLVPLELLQVLGQSFVAPLALVFYAMFYLDMRVRREGLDLERRLDARQAVSA